MLRSNPKLLVRGPLIFISRRLGMGGGSVNEVIE